MTKYTCYIYDAGTGVYLDTRTVEADSPDAAKALILENASSTYPVMIEIREVHGDKSSS